VAAKATDESDFVMFTRLCVVDAIVEHALLHHKGDYTPSFPARLKDQLLRLKPVYVARTGRRGKSFVTSIRV
jgi:hypothetical protein